MSDDEPIRILDDTSPELDGLRDALREAQAQQPGGAWRERMALTIDDALKDPTGIALADTFDDDIIDRDRPSFEPPPSSRAEFTTEAELAEPFPDVAEAEVGADLTAGLLAAGAAMAWLRRRTMKRDDEDS